MMKREILFRGKRADNGEWVEGLLGYCNFNHGAEKAIYTTKTGSIIPHSIKQATVGQFIGLCDKNGKKIFEGDILVFVDAETPETERAIVVYDDGGYKLKYLNYDYMDDLYGTTAKLQVVIGNVYDNPELLEVKDEKHEKAD